MLKHMILAAVAASGVVSGQSVCTAKSRTAQTQADLDALRSCTTLTGDLIIGPNLVNAIIPEAITTIGGDLTVANNVVMLSLTGSVATIGGVFNLTANTVLATLSFPNLKSVGTIYWQTLPGLGALTGWNGVTRADSVTITDTSLESLLGINLVSVARFDINNNRYLKEVDVQLGNITDSLHIEFNAATLSASFPNLTWANNATFRSCQTVNLPNLQTVNGSIGFFENTLTSISAPKLTKVGTGDEGGDLTIANNNDLTNVTMPLLMEIDGTLQLVNNSEITAVDGFNKLAVVHGSIDISGEFDDAAFPAIKDVRGGFNVQTTSKFDCGDFDKYESNGVVKGDYFCKGALENPGVEGTTPTSNGTDDGSSGSGSGSSDKPNAGTKLSGMNSFAAIPAVALFAALFL